MARGKTDRPGRGRWAALQSAYLQEEIKATHNIEETVGRSSALTDVLRRVELVAATESELAGQRLVGRRAETPAGR